jgi:hypothetical protein
VSHWFEPTEKMKSEWAAWVATRPQPVRLMVEKHGFAPWKLYRLKSSNHRVTIYSFDEPSSGGPPTLKVDVSGAYNLVLFERMVFGIEPDDLEECDLPGPDEPVGSAGLSIEEAKDLHEDIETIKKLMASN